MIWYCAPTVAHDAAAPVSDCAPTVAHDAAAPVSDNATEHAASHCELKSTATEHAMQDPVRFCSGRA